MPGRNSGTFSTGYARIEKVRKSKSPVARVARQLAYSPLVAMSVTSAVMRRSLSAGMRTPTFNVFTKSSRRSTAEIQAWPCASLSRPPTQIGAHARSQLRHLFDRVRPDREGAQIEIASGPGCTPARILALGGDERDLGGNATIAERGNAHPDLQRLHQVLAQVDSRNPGLALCIIIASANPDRRPCPVATPAPFRPGTPGSRRCANRNRQWPGLHASSHTRPWWR